MNVVTFCVVGLIKPVPNWEGPVCKCSALIAKLFFIVGVCWELLELNLVTVVWIFAYCSICLNPTYTVTDKAD